MTARSRLATLVLATALLLCLAGPALAAPAWVSGYGASPTSFKQGGGRYTSISVTPTADSLALVTVRDAKGTIATLGYGWIHANATTSWKWFGLTSAGKIAPTGTYTYWIRLTRGRTSHWYKGQVSKYSTKVVLPVSSMAAYQWGTDGEAYVPLSARPAFFTITSQDPFFEEEPPGSGNYVNQTVHNTVWFTNGNDVAVPGAPQFLLDALITTNDPDVTTSPVVGIPSPGTYKLHWNVESDTSVTIRQ